MLLKTFRNIACTMTQHHCSADEEAKVASLYSPQSFFPLCFFHLLLSFSSPSLLLSLCVFLQRLPAFKHHTAFLPTGPPPQAHEESEQQVSLSVNARIYDFLFDLSSLFPCFISEGFFQLSLNASKAVAKEKSIAIRETKNM